MTAALAAILAILLVAAVIYILVQAELHHEDAGMIRDLKARVIVQQLEVVHGRKALRETNGALKLALAVLRQKEEDEYPLLDNVTPIHDSIRFPKFGGWLDDDSELLS